MVFNNSQYHPFKYVSYIHLWLKARVTNLKLKICLAGYEDAAISALRCPDPTLGYFRYTYTDQAGTFCSSVNTSTLKNCNSSLNYGEFIVNNTGCTTKSPFYSCEWYLFSKQLLFYEAEESVRARYQATILRRFNGRSNVV
jgi:hypothetical protein